MRNPTPISVMKSSNPLDDSSSNLPSMKGSSAAWPEAAARRAESSSRGSMVRVVCVDWAVTTFQLATKPRSPPNTGDGEIAAVTCWHRDLGPA